MKPKKKKMAARKAVYGEKMIEVRLRFWTNDIAPQEGKIIPKHAWTSGVVRIEPNKSHGIKAGSPIPFHSLLDVGAGIQKVLIKQGIVLHPGDTMAKYLK